MQHTAYYFKTAKKEDITSVFQILQTVFRPTYGTILSEEQICWMLNNIFSEEALLKQQQQENFRFILLVVQQQVAGFAAIELNFEERDRICKLHKLYLKLSFQGNGWGKLLMKQAIQTAGKCHQASLLLNVNRFNKARLFYEKYGFQIVDEVDIPLENGYFMNDYVMQKAI